MNDFTNPNTLANTSPFSNWACSHEYFDTILQWLLSMIFGLSDPAILLVIGPTGVGKSTLIHQLCASLAQRLMGELQANPSRLHKVYAEAQYIPGRGFDWDDLFESMLRDAGEILIDRKVDPDGPPKRPGRAGLAGAANEMLRRRTPAACIIDEGAVFLESDSTDSLKRVLNFLKTFGNRSRTHIVIFGDYRLAEMVAFCGQLNRRCYPMHFPNYGDAYRAPFDKVVRAFEKRLIARGTKAKLVEEADLLFANTCGCVGLLKRWVEYAWIGIQGSDRVLDRAVLLSRPVPGGSLVQWRREIKDGHSRMHAFFAGPDSKPQQS